MRVKWLKIEVVCGGCLTHLMLAGVLLRGSVCVCVCARDLCTPVVFQHTTGDVGGGRSVHAHTHTHTCVPASFVKTRPSPFVSLLAVFLLLPCPRPHLETLKYNSHYCDVFLFTVLSGSFLVLPSTCRVLCSASQAGVAPTFLPHLPSHTLLWQVFMPEIVIDFLVVYVGNCLGQQRLDEPNLNENGDWVKGV